MHIVIGFAFLILILVSSILYFTSLPPLQSRTDKPTVILTFDSKWGFGDYIRGLYHNLAMLQQNNVPVKLHFPPPYHLYLTSNHPHVESAPDNTKFIQTHRQLWQKLHQIPTTPVLWTSSNEPASPDEMKWIQPKISEWIRPTAELEAIIQKHLHPLVNSTVFEIPSHTSIRQPYLSLYFRCGDSYLPKHNNFNDNLHLAGFDFHATMKRALEQVQSEFPAVKNIIFHCDSFSFRNEIVQTYNLSQLEAIQPVHLASVQHATNQDIADTLAEFFIMSRATAIFCLRHKKKSFGGNFALFASLYGSTPYHVVH